MQALLLLSLNENVLLFLLLKIITKTTMNKHNTPRCLLTFLLGLSMNGVVSAQTFTTIGEVKQLTSNADVTINFQPNTVQVAALERDGFGNVGGTYLWDGKDGLFLFNSMLPSWPINDLKVGDYVNGTLSGLWEYNYWDIYNADGDISIGANAPLVPLKTSGNEIVENGAYNKFGLYEIDGVFNLDRLQFVSDDGVVFSVEDLFGQQLPVASSHGTLRAMCYQGEIANYLWPYQANAFTPDDKPFTMEPTLSSDVVYDIKDLKRCLTGTRLEIKDGYRIQVINTLGNAYFLWDGEQGLWLHDASRKIADRVHEGSTITSGTLFCDTQAGLWGCTGSEGLTVDDNQTDLAPADKELKDLSPADLFAYIRVFGTIEQGKYGNYVLRHGGRHIALADRFNYGFDLAKLVGKQGYVNAVYHVVGNCLILHPANCFEEVTDVVAATRLTIPEHPARKSYTIDGKRISDIPSTSKDIFIENGKKVIK